MEAKQLNNKICQCCGMPLNNELFSHEQDGKINEEYCMWCYKNGKFVYQNIDELIDTCIPHMVAQGFKEEEARTYMKQMLPNLKYWREKNN